MKAFGKVSFKTRLFSRFSSLFCFKPTWTAFLAHALCWHWCFVAQYGICDFPPTVYTEIMRPCTIIFSNKLFSCKQSVVRNKITFVSKKDNRIRRTSFVVLARLPFCNWSKGNFFRIRNRWKLNFVSVFQLAEAISVKHQWPTLSNFGKVYKGKNKIKERKS